MSIVKSWFDEGTKINIHDDFIKSDEKELKEMIISILLNKIKNNELELY